MNYSLKYPELAQALYLALKPDPYFKYIKSCISEEPDIAKRGMLAYMDYSILEAQEFAEVFIPSDVKYGVSIWSKPLNSELQTRKRQLKDEFLHDYLGEAAFRQIRKVSLAMDANLVNRIHPTEWYLSIVGVSPEYQGQGLGPGLIEPILKKADALNVATFLETYTARNHTFYQRLGYVDVEKFYQPLVKANYWLMRRAAPTE
jgi:GNAT superfamily N-acetyltransferase